MSDYQSYSMYRPEENQDASYSPPVVRETGTTYSNKIVDGEVTSEASQKHHSVNSRELTPYAEDDWRSTAVKQNGFPAVEITKDTIVRLGGTQGRVADFVAAGILQETATGFELAGAEDTPSDTQRGAEEASDAPGMPQEIVMAMDAAMEPFDDHTLDAGLSLGIASLTGELDFSTVVHKLSMGSGIEPKDAQQRAQFIMDAFQIQTDGYLAKQGIGKEDLPEFFEFARSRKGDMRMALEQQIRQHNLAGWKPLVSKFLSNTAPSLQALQENGFKTRTADKQAQVLVNGSWVSTGADVSVFLCARSV